ncbi:MAG: metal-dependent transcriptional regulator [Methanomassiliicoccaceae archaeon]|jgi:DtxR family Mn-dependent transcriptional regulator|nr:metal-dependent transcriptional regulator [Methanomassiliicoccaceae archaeon]
MASGNREDYLLRILRLTNGDGIAKTTDIAALMNVSAASVTEMLRILANDELITYKKYKGVSLTPEGLAMAKRIRDKHQIAERFLMDVLDKDQGDAHEEACKMEHILSDESARRMCRIVGAAEMSDCEALCGSECIKKASGIQLNKISAGMAGKISHLKCDDAEKIRKLISIGFVPGRTISMVNRTTSNGPIIFRMGESNIALDQELASLVFVNVDQ